jgi:hypothetical protein
METVQKNIAHTLAWIESRGAMSNVARLPNRGRAFVATFVFAAFLWTLALSVSPQLHERIHPDANRAEHSCAVTFIASGNYDHSPTPQIVGVPDSVDQFSSVPALTPKWVESAFLLARIFEHAPPALI